MIIKPAALARDASWEIILKGIRYTGEAVGASTCIGAFIFRKTYSFDPERYFAILQWSIFLGIGLSLWVAFEITVLIFFSPGSRENGLKVLLGASFVWISAIIAIVKLNTL